MYINILLETTRISVWILDIKFGMFDTIYIYCDPSRRDQLAVLHASGRHTTPFRGQSFFLLKT